MYVDKDSSKRLVLFSVASMPIEQSSRPSRILRGLHPRSTSKFRPTMYFSERVVIFNQVIFCSPTSCCWSFARVASAASWGRLYSWRCDGRKSIVAMLDLQSRECFSKVIRYLDIEVVTTQDVNENLKPRELGNNQSLSRVCVIDWSRHTNVDLCKLQAICEHLGKGIKGQEKFE